MNQTPLVIGIGSNTSDRQFQIEKAIEALLTKFEQGQVSDVYESEAVNGKDAPYLNAVFAGITTLDMDATIKWLKETERNAGRTEIDSIEGKISLDLDLVIWDRRIIRPKDFDRHYFNIGYRQLLATGAFQYEV